MKNLKAKTDARKGLGVPGRIYDIESKKQKISPKKIAEGVLKKIAPELKIDADLSQLKFDEVKDSILGKHVLYQQQEQGKPISGAWIRVDIDKEGKVYNIQNDLVPFSVLDKAQKAKDKKSKAAPRQINVEEAKKIALKAAKVKGNMEAEITDTELTWYSKDGIPTLSWKVVVSVTHPVAQWKFYIDALTKVVLKKLDLLKSAKAVGRVFDPNPVIKLNGVKLKPNSKIPDEAYVEVELPGLGKSGYLDGPYVSTKRTKKRIKRTTLNFKFKKED